MLPAKFTFYRFAFLFARGLGPPPPLLLLGAAGLVCSSPVDIITDDL